MCPSGSTLQGCHTLHPLYTFYTFGASPSPARSPTGNACCVSEELSRFPLEVESERDKGPQLELFNQTK